MESLWEESKWVIPYSGDERKGFGAGLFAAAATEVISTRSAKRQRIIGYLNAVFLEKNGICIKIYLPPYILKFYE